MRPTTIGKRRTAKRTLVGLDIGATGVRAAQLVRRGESWEVERLTRSDSSRASGSEPDPSDWAAESERRILACLGNAEFNGRDVAVALCSPDVEFHTLEIPATILAGRQTDVDAVVRSEVHRLLGGSERVDIGQIVAQHWTLPDSAVPGPNALGCAAQRETLDRTLSICRAACVECRCVDASATALCRFGCQMQSWEREELWGVLDLGARQARLVLCVEGVPVLARRVAEGGVAWTRRIAESLEISGKAAEIQKCEHGLTLLGSPAPVGQPNGRSELGSILLGILRADITALATEIKKSYEYVLSCYPQGHAADLVLVGGGAGLRCLPELLSHELGISVKPAAAYLEHSSCRLRYGSNEPRSLAGFALAVGLSLFSRVA